MTSTMSPTSGSRRTRRSLPVQKTCADFLKLSVAMAKTVKRMDPAADVLGPVSYGSEGYFTFQNAPDWPAIQASTGYRWFIDYSSTR